VIQNMNARVGDLSLLAVGDLLFFDRDTEDGPRLDHVGMYLGPDAGAPIASSPVERLIMDRPSATWVVVPFSTAPANSKELSRRSEALSSAVSPPAEPLSCGLTARLCARYTRSYVTSLQRIAGHGRFESLAGSALAESSSATFAGRRASSYRQEERDGPAGYVSPPCAPRNCRWSITPTAPHTP